MSVLLNNSISNASLTITDNSLSNIAPTLTSFDSSVATGNEDSQILISFDILIAHGDEADFDGTVTAFDIKSLTSGTLLIGTKAFDGKVGEINFIKGILSGDTNGDKVADFELFITLVGGTTLANVDFVL